MNKSSANAYLPPRRADSLPSNDYVLEPRSNRRSKGSHPLVKGRWHVHARSRTNDGASGEFLIFNPMTPGQRSVFGMNAILF